MFSDLYSEQKSLLFQCLCFGFRPNGKLIFIIVRLLLLILFMLIHIPIQRYKWSDFTCLLFSLIVSSIIALFLLILYAYSKVINKSFEMSSDSLELIPIESPPPGISKILWSKRNLYSFEEDKLQQTAFDLINAGFQPSEVYALAEFMKDSIAGQVATKSKKKSKHNYLRIGSKIIEFPLSNKKFFFLFPFPRKLFYILLVFIVLNLQLFLVAKESHLFPNRDYFWLCIVSGACIYSTIQPPPTEFYSSTYDHIENGISRPFYLSLVLFFMYLVENLKIFFPKIISYLNLEISLNYDSFVPFLINIFKMFIYLAPLISVFILLQPSLVILYFLEGINRFVLGFQGSPSLILGILQSIKGILIGIISHYIYKWNSKFNTCVLVISAFVIINLPVHGFGIREFLVFLWILILTVGFSILHTYYHQRNANNIATTVLILLEAAFYYCSTNAQYFIIFIKFRMKTKIVNYIIYFISRIINQYVLCFLIFKEISEGYKYPTWLYGIFVSNMINNVSSNIPCFALSYIIRNLMEIDFHTPIFDYFLCNWLAYKIIKAYYIVYDFSNHRTEILSIDDGTMEINQVLGNLSGFLINYIPFIDQVLNIPHLFLSILLDFLWNSFYFTEFLMAPRPNVFWSAFPRHSSLGIKKLDLAEAPIESPCFESCYWFLQKWLCYAVQSGKLGLVNENSIYFFKSASTEFFVHIISLTPSSVYFQLRGLEEKLVTDCHSTENRIMSDICMPCNCFELGIAMLVTNYSLIKTNIEMNFYEIFKTDLPSMLLFCNTNLDSSIDAILTDFCLRNVDILHQVETNSEENFHDDQIPQNLEETRNRSNSDSYYSESEDEDEYSQSNENNQNLNPNSNHEPHNQNDQRSDNTNNTNNPQNQPQNPENNEILPEINERIQERIMTISREIKRLLLEHESGVRRQNYINAQNFYYLFTGNSSHSLNSWLVNHEHLMAKIVRPTLQAMLRQFMFDNIDPDCEVITASIDSLEFKEALEKRMPFILTMNYDTKINQVYGVLYRNSDAMFDCFRMNPFDVFSLWSRFNFNKFLDVPHDEKRESWYNLAKTVISACDRPFGRVAYTSPVGVSYNNFIV